MRKNVLTGETSFCRAYLRAVIDQVEVGDGEIRIIGRKTVLERLVMGGGSTPSGVPSFILPGAPVGIRASDSCPRAPRRGIHLPKRSKPKKRLAFGSRRSMCVRVRGSRLTGGLPFAPIVA
jgi:hypothetical protein